MARTEWAYQIERARSGEVSASAKVEWSRVFHEFQQEVLVDPLDAVKRGSKEAWLNVRPKGFDQNEAIRELRQRRAYPGYSDSEPTLVNAKRVVLIAEIAVERHRGRYGKAPEDLKSLVPEFMPSVPQEWFGEEPQYERLPGGQPRIYSYSLLPRCGGFGGASKRDYLRTTDQDLIIPPKSYEFCETK